MQSTVRLHYRNSLVLCVHEESIIHVDADWSMIEKIQGEEEYRKWAENNSPRKTQIIAFDERSVPVWTDHHWQAPPIYIKSIMMFLIDVAHRQSLDFPWNSMGDFSLETAMNRLGLNRDFYGNQARDVASLYSTLETMYFTGEHPKIMFATEEYNA